MDRGIGEVLRLHVVVQIGELDATADGIGLYSSYKVFVPLAIALRIRLQSINNAPHTSCNAATMRSSIDDMRNIIRSGCSTYGAPALSTWPA